MKTCGKCRIEKELTEFHKNNKTKDGYKCYCKLCVRLNDIANKDLISLKSKIYREKNKEKHKAYQIENKEKYKQHNKNYKINNKIKISEKAKIYSLKNKEKIKITSKNHRISNPEYYKNAKTKRRLMENSRGKLSKGIIKTLYHLQQGLCVCCREPLGEDYHLDHIMPLKLGGANTDDNVQLMKAKCNMSKQAKHPIDYMQSKGFLL
jgi:hypothetical protein